MLGQAWSLHLLGFFSAICLGAGILKQCFLESPVVCLHCVFSLCLLCTLLYWKKVHDSTTKDKKMVFIAFRAHFSYDLAAEQIAQRQSEWILGISIVSVPSSHCHTSYRSSWLLSTWNLIVLRQDACRAGLSSWCSLTWSRAQPHLFVCKLVTWKSFYV